MCRLRCGHLLTLKVIETCLISVIGNSRELNSLHHLGLVHTKPGEFEYGGGVSLKTHQMFSVNTAPETFKNADSDYFEVVFEENTTREIT